MLWNPCFDAFAIWHLYIQTSILITHGVSCTIRLSSTHRCRLLSLAVGSFWISTAWIKIADLVELALKWNMSVADSSWQSTDVVYQGKSRHDVTAVRTLQFWIDNKVKRLISIRPNIYLLHRHRIRTIHFQVVWTLILRKGYVVPLSRLQKYVWFKKHRPKKEVARIFTDFHAAYMNSNKFPRIWYYKKFGT